MLCVTDHLAQSIRSLSYNIDIRKLIPPIAGRCQFWINIIFSAPGYQQNDTNIKTTSVLC